MIRTDGRCLRCGGCVSVCPRDALTLTDEGIACSGRCTDCGICIRFCPVMAIRMNRGENNPAGGGRGEK